MYNSTILHIVLLKFVLAITIVGVCDFWNILFPLRISRIKSQMLYVEPDILFPQEANSSNAS